ncbi:MAG: hypothetical protein AB4911_06210 [Oscillochloridaceae bacterium umkhey_bin13]
MPTDFDRFIATTRHEADLFDPGRPLVAARGPGWVDLIGGAAADGGALALGWPLGGGAFVAAQPVPEHVIRLATVRHDHQQLALHELELDDGWPREYADVAVRLADQPELVRLAGAVWLALAREEFVRPRSGVSLFVRPSDSPGGQVGLAAALAQALVTTFDVHLSPRELALAVQVALRELGPADPGVLGPLVSVCAHGAALLQVHQQPAWLWGSLHLPPGAALWSVRIGHGPDPHQALPLRVASAMAYQLAVAASGLPPADAHARWLGYLSNLGTAAYEARIRAALPEQFNGADFLAQHGSLPGLPIDPAVPYPVRAAAALAIEEHLRARMIAALLRAAASKAQRDEDLHLVGELMARSHGGQRAAGLSDPQADALVAQIYTEGAEHGLYGARAAAASSGATLVVLGRTDAELALRELVANYGRTHQLATSVHGSSSSGASAAGTREG